MPATKTVLTVVTPFGTFSQNTKVAYATVAVWDTRTGNTVATWHRAGAKAKSPGGMWILKGVFAV